MVNFFKILMPAIMVVVFIVCVWGVGSTVQTQVSKTQDSNNVLGDYNYLGLIKSFELGNTGIVRTCKTMTYDGNIYAGNLYDCKLLEIGKPFCQVNVYDEGTNSLTGINYIESKYRVCEVSSKWK
jgi:hypothetical protein